MRVGPMFKWFGSKWQSAKHYPLPQHRTIIEPYAGGAGYSLNYADRAVCIYDADVRLSALWKWLIREATRELILDIPVGLNIGTDIRTIQFLNAGQKLLLKHWQRTNNVGECWTVSPGGDKPGQWTINTRARVADEVSAIKHWTFEPPDFTENATYFVDPPYLYNYRYRKGNPSIDYTRLAACVRSLTDESMVIVCEARHPLTGKAPAYLPFNDSHRSVTSRRKLTQSHHSKELVYIRYPKSR